MFNSLIGTETTKHIHLLFRLLCTNDGVTKTLVTRTDTVTYITPLVDEVDPYRSPVDR